MWEGYDNRCGDGSSSLEGSWGGGEVRVVAGSEVAKITETVGVPKIS